MSFPWVAGQVVNEGSGKGSTGFFKIVPLDKAPRLAVKDLRDESSQSRLTMDALRRASFPISMLDESIVAPRNTLRGAGEPDSWPVFLVQVNLILGGLILTFNGQHQAMDMLGQAEIIRLLSKACRNESFTKEELSAGNIDRRNLIPLLDDDSYRTHPGLAFQMVKPKDGGDHQTTVAPPESTWSSLIFPPSALVALKALATKDIAPSTYISTDDALSAFIWQSVMRARLPRLDPTATYTLARAADIRRCLDISPRYPGIMQNVAFGTSTLQDLVEEPLGSIASRLRSILEPAKLKQHAQALATCIDRAPDKSVTSFTATIDQSQDLVISSWAKCDCYEQDFGLGLGTPEAVRRPRFIPFESLFYLLPKALDGEIAVALCLRDEDLERLKADEEFARYGRFRG